MGVKVELYNASMCLWEPLVEEFHFHVTAEIKEGAMPFTDVSLNATQPCNVNLSPSMSSLISSTLLTLADDVAGKQALSLAEGTTVSMLLEQMALAGKRVSVERNGEIVPRSQHAQALLADGDRLEIVVAVGGG
jgi:sulfur carrier protein